MRRLPVFGALLTTLALIGPSSPATQAAADDLPPDVGWVPRDTGGFVCLRTAALLGSGPARELRERLAKEVPAILRDVEQFEKSLGVSLADVERLTLVMLESLPQDEGATLILATTKPYDRAKVVQAASPGAKEQRHANRTYYAGARPRSPALFLASDRVFVVGPEKGVRQLLSRHAARQEQGKWNEALSLAARDHAVVAGLDTELLKNEFARNPPSLAWLWKPVLQGERTTLIADLKEDVRLDLRLTFAGDELAHKQEKSLKTELFVVKEYLAHFRKDNSHDPEGAARLRPIFEQIQAALKTLAVRRQQAEVSLSAPADADLAKAILVELAIREKEARLARLQSADNMRLLVRAMHRYRAQHDAFPPAALRTKDGKPLVSWRVLLLPYLDENSLFQQFKLNEPWSSRHNKKLLGKIPRVFSPVLAKKDPFATFYQVFVGPGAAFEEKQATRTPEITNGAAQTLLIVEAGEAVPWTKPADLAFDVARPLPRLGGLFHDSFHAALADGTVRFLNGRQLTERTLKAIITRNGGDDVGSDW
jgi:hypothetical protein